MKQKYSSPQMNVLELRMQSLLAASIGEVPVKPNIPAVPASYEKEPSSETSNWEHKW